MTLKNFSTLKFLIYLITLLGFLTFSTYLKTLLGFLTMTFSTYFKTLLCFFTLTFSTYLKTLLGFLTSTYLKTLLGFVTLTFPDLFEDLPGLFDIINLFKDLTGLLNFDPECIELFTELPLLKKLAQDLLGVKDLLCLVDSFDGGHDLGISSEDLIWVLLVESF